jgi:enoyl-CoA hydratase/carnithine racemase
MSPTAIRYEVEDGVATITLNRPEKLNAFNRDMGRELISAFDAVDADDAVRAVIVTGAGRGFCAGADMGGLQAIGAGAATDRSSKAQEGLPGGSTLAEFKMNYSYFPSIPKFIIAAINGPCAGLGLVIPLYADLRFASESAVFTTAFAQRGLIAEHGVSWLLPRLIGRDPGLRHPARQHRLAALGGGDEAPALGSRVPDPGRGHGTGQPRDGSLLPDRRLQGRRRPLPGEARCALHRAVTLAGVCG